MRLRRPASRSAVSRSPATSPSAPGIGTRPRVLAEQAADGVDVLVVDVDVEQLAEVVDVQRAGTRVVPSAELLDPGALPVVLVGDLADDLLEDVLDGDQAGRAAVLVDDDRDVVWLALHLAQQVVDRLAVGHEDGRAHHVLDVHLAGARVGCS